MDLILLIFFCVQIGKQAEKKGLNPGLWRWRLVGVWLLFELVGLYIAGSLFGMNKDNLFGIFLFALASAFGGYLIIKNNLDNRPDAIDNDIDNIGNS